MNQQSYADSQEETNFVHPQARSSHCMEESQPQSSRTKSDYVEPQQMSQDEQVRVQVQPQTELQAARAENLQLLEQMKQDRHKLNQKYQRMISNLKQQHQKHIQLMKLQQEKAKQSLETRNKIFEDMETHLKQSAQTVRDIKARETDALQITKLRGQLSIQQQAVKTRDQELQSLRDTLALRDKRIQQLNSELEELKSRTIAKLKQQLREKEAKSAEEKTRHASEINTLKRIHEQEINNERGQSYARVLNGSQEHQAALKAQQLKLQARIKSQNDLLKKIDQLDQQNANLKNKQENYKKLLRDKTQLSQRNKILEGELKQAQKTSADQKTQLQNSIQESNRNFQNFKKDSDCKIGQISANFKKEFKLLEEKYQQSHKIATNTHQRNIEAKERSIKQLQQQISKGAKAKDELKSAAQKERRAFEEEKQALSSLLNQYKTLQENLRMTLIKNRAPEKQIKLANINQFFEQLLANSQSKLAQQQRENQLTEKYSKQLCDYSKQLKENISDIIKLARMRRNISQPLCKSLGDPNHLGQDINQLVDAFQEVIQDLKGQLRQKGTTLEYEILNTKNAVSELAAWKKRHNGILEQKCLMEGDLMKKDSQILDLQRDLRQGADEIKSLRSTVNSREASIAKLQDQLNKSRQQYEKKIKQLQEKIMTLEDSLAAAQKDISTLNQKIRQYQMKIKELEAELAKELAKMTRQKNQKEVELDSQNRLTKELQLRQEKEIKLIGEGIQKALGTERLLRSSEDILSFLSTQATSVETSAFTVSELLESLPKERRFLDATCCNLLQCRIVSTKLSYKYDQNWTNFGFYIPLPANKFPFAVIFRTKSTQHVFGLICSSIGKEAEVLAYNLRTMKLMDKLPKSRAMPCSFENNTLKFGNEEISIKNNGRLELNLNTSIVGEKYFNFGREDLVGAGLNNPISLDALEIHRIYKS